MSAKDAHILVRVLWCCAEALRELAADLGSSSNADRERSASMLSGLTIFLEHHDTLYAAGIFPALIRAVLDAGNVPQASHFHN